MDLLLSARGYSERMVLGLRDIAAEAVLLAGGGRAILLQIANPAVGHAVARHSDFASRPLDRLKATMTYVYAVVYGTPADIDTVRRRVNAAHVPVRADASGTDPGYSAFDPALQLWVTATLYDTAITVHERVLGALDEASADRIYAEYATIGSTLQLPVGLWPADRAAFARWWDAELTTLDVDSESLRVAGELLHPNEAPWWLRAAMPLGRLATAGLLPPQLRAAYELPWSARRERRFERWMRVITLLYPRLPRRLRHGLRDRYLRELRTSTPAG